MTDAFAVLKVNGIGRKYGRKVRGPMDRRTLELYLSREFSDDEMRSIHDAIRSAMMAQGERPPADELVRQRRPVQIDPRGAALWDEVEHYIQSGGTLPISEPDSRTVGTTVANISNMPADDLDVQQIADRVRSICHEKGYAAPSNLIEFGVAVWCVATAAALREQGTEIAKRDAEIAELRDWDVRGFYKTLKASEVYGLSHEDGWTMIETKNLEQTKALNATRLEALLGVRELAALETSAIWRNAVAMLDAAIAKQRERT